MTDYLIIGNGVAGTTSAESIREQDGLGNITIVTEEDLPYYYRIRLPEYISGDIDEKGLIAKKASWYDDREIELVLNSRVTDIVPGEKKVVAEDKRIFSYDSLLIATGSHCFIPPIQGSDRKGVFSLRDIRDARNISSYAEEIENVVLIGGGLLGLETGNALRKLGKRVTVVEFFPRLLPRQLDNDGAVRLRNIMENMGFSFRLGAKTREIAGNDKVKEVILEDGENLPAGMVIISAGVRPNMELAGLLGLDTDKGIKVNEHLKTSRPDVFAAGDAAEFRGFPYGIWPAAMEQGKIAGACMAGSDTQYKGTTMANSLKVVGVDLASSGDIDEENKHESIRVTNENVYKKLVLENNRIIGCIMLGDTRGFNKITRAISEERNVSGFKDKILTDGFDFNKL